MRGSEGGRSPRAAAGVGHGLGKLHPDPPRLAVPVPSLSLARPRTLLQAAPVPGTQWALRSAGCEVEGPEPGLPRCTELKNCPIHLDSSEPGSGPGSPSAPATYGRKECTSAWLEPWVGDFRGPLSRAGELRSRVRSGMDGIVRVARPSGEILPFLPLAPPEGPGALILPQECRDRSRRYHHSGGSDHCSKDNDTEFCRMFSCISLCTKDFTRISRWVLPAAA